MNIGKRLLFAIITLVVIIAVVIVIGNYWDIISTSPASQSAWLFLITHTNELIFLVIGIIVTAISGLLWRLLWGKWVLPRLQGRGLYVNVEKCMHSPAHSREQKRPTGTKMSVTFSFENNLGKRTFLTGVQLIAPYETEKEPPKAPFVLQDGSKSYYLEDITPGHYTHRFFIKNCEILEPKLKCVFRLFYLPHAEKRINGVSERQPVR